MLKLDYMVSVRPAQREVFLLVAEIKPPNNCSHENVCDDKVKLGKEMKNMMDTMEMLKINDAQTAGLLVQGTCDLIDDFTALTR